MKHLYVNYLDSDSLSSKKWMHSHYCWCRGSNGEGQRMASTKTPLDFQNYAYFDRDVPSFPVDKPKRVFSAEADIEIVEDKTMEFDVVASTRDEAMKKAKDFIRRQYPYRTCIRRVSIEELL